MDSYSEAEEDDDDNDGVIKEIPVYLCKDLHEKLYLFQFPCRPADSNPKNTVDSNGMNTQNIVSSRVKPESGIIELDCALQTNSKFYDEHMGEELAIREKTNEQKSKDTTNESSASNAKLLDKITQQSQRSVLKKDIPCYSIATLYKGKFCVSPLHDAVSFLPTYNHVEGQKKAKKAKNSFIDDSESSSDEEVDESSPAVQVTVKFTQRNLDKSKMPQEMSHQQHINKMTDEPWCETKFKQSSFTDLATSRDLSKIFSRKVTPMLSLSENEYLDVLIPPETIDTIQKPSQSAPS